MRTWRNRSDYGRYDRVLWCATLLSAKWFTGSACSRSILLLPAKYRSGALARSSVLFDWHLKSDRCSDADVYSFASVEPHSFNDRRRIRNFASAFGDAPMMLGLGQPFSNVVVTPAVLDACGQNPCTDWDYLMASSDCEAFGICTTNVATCGQATCTVGQAAAALGTQVGDTLGAAASAALNAAGSTAGAALQNLNIAGYATTALVILGGALALFLLIQVEK